MSAGGSHRSEPRRRVIMSNTLLSFEEFESRRQMCEECMSEYCVWNPGGICMYPIVYGKRPDLDEDGCYQYMDGGMI